MRYLKMMMVLGIFVFGAFLPVEAGACPPDIGEVCGQCGAGVKAMIDMPMRFVPLIELGAYFCGLFFIGVARCFFGGIFLGGVILKNGFTAFVAYFWL